MADMIVTERSNIEAIANAVRSKTGESGNLTLGGIAAGISRISTGITPSGTLNITENGTYDVESYASAVVDVASSGGGESENAIINGTLSQYTNNKVTSIRDYAFYNCSNLTSIDFPTAVTIGSSAFYSCPNLATVNFPVTTTINNFAFTSCYSLTTVSFPAATSIGSYAFSNCYNLKAINSPNVTSIGQSAFLNCRNLTEANFPAAISIYNDTFNGCTSLKTLNFSALKTIGYYAFSRCTGLQTASFPAVTTISANAFNGCTGLTTVDSPLNTFIGSYAFYSCTNLTSINSPMATTIGSSAFENCIRLETAIFPAATTVGSRAFSNCKALKTIDFSAATIINNNAFYLCSSLTAVNLPVTTAIYSYAFDDCHRLSSFILGASVVCTLSNSNAFSSTPYAGYKSYFSGTPHIYVPASLIDSYKTATNWVYYSSYFTGVSLYFPLDSQILFLGETKNLFIETIQTLSEVSPVNITSDNENIVSVSNIQLTSNGVYFDLNSYQIEGHAKITISSIYNNENIETSFDVTVKDMTEIQQTNTKTIKINTVNNMSINLINMNTIPNVTITSSNDSVVSISNVVITSENISFDITAHESTSSANILITAIYNNKTYNNEFTVNVVEKLPEYNVESLDTAYGFELNNSGYYESNNKNINSSFALCKINIDTPFDCIMHVDCINYAESNYDYGILSNLDTTLVQSATADSYNVKQSFKGMQSEDIQTVSYDVPAGNHYIYVKYIKDSSGHHDNDSLQFTVRLEY